MYPESLSIWSLLDHGIRHDHWCLEVFWKSRETARCWRDRGADRLFALKIPQCQYFESRRCIDHNRHSPCTHPPEALYKVLVPYSSCMGLLLSRSSHWRGSVFLWFRLYVLWESIRSHGPNTRHGSVNLSLDGCILAFELCLNVTTAHNMKHRVHR